MSLFDRVGRFLDDVVLLPEETRKSLEAADTARADGLLPEAEALYRDVLEARPSSVPGLLGLARVLAATGRLQEARLQLDTVRTSVPEDAAVATLAARWALDAGDAAAAARHAGAASWALASEGGEPFAEACALRAQAERAQGRPDRAARELEKALSVRPNDPKLAAEVIEALCESGARRRARALSRRYLPAELPGPIASRVGLSLARTGLMRHAMPFLLRAAGEGDALALSALATARLEEGELADAERYARQAVAAGAAALPLLGDILAASNASDDAADAYEAAYHATRDVTLLHRALALVSVDDFERLERLAAPLGADDEWRVLGLALAALAAGDTAPALALPSSHGLPRSALARAMAELQSDHPRETLLALDQRLASLAEQLDSLTAPADVILAASLRRRALRARWLDVHGRVDVPALMEEVAAFAQARDLAALCGAAREAREALDRPLILAVMGEFNAGKSTLINAFVGAEVAPMGIVPTTASLNILKMGGERRVRVVCRDGSTREGGFDALGRFLDEAEDAQAASVDHVEILLPSPLLEQVWILDTPGLNALDPRHAELAREAARRADAVVWVFDAAQAGKATEASALAAVRQSGRPVVRVLNKADRLSPEELGRVLALFESDGQGAAPVALSAKRALRARVAGEEDPSSGFAGLMQRLEADIFSRSRSLKRRASALRLAAALTASREQEEHRVLPERARAAELDAARRRLRELSLDDVVLDALRALDAARDKAFVSAADEVLAFARPRREFWTKNGAEPEDRVFLEGVLERALAEASERASRKLLVELSARTGACLGEARFLLPDARDLLSARLDSAFASLSGYERGLRAGGALRRFFEQQLPSAELTSPVIARALVRARADLGAELTPGLLGAVAEVQERLVSAAVEGSAQAQRAVDRIERERIEPLSALRDVIESVATASMGHSQAASTRL